MSEPIITVEHLSKSYILKHQNAERYTALRDVITNKAKSIFKGGNSSGSQTSEEFWALNDVSFNIQQGDRVGIIGRNGAGKSTLLKVLSRIVTPTKGRITIEGRVASLLEVGTGFHAELSGRENIYLNGSILGMSKAEISSKFDEIVAFAEVENFLDTPVKRYSSGMYVRLAFAVAAHLDPEILIVDEVLAVGDAAFQKKCMSKMRDVAGKGKTILFVSHNMAAIQNLCDKCIYLKNGTVVQQGLTEDVIHEYLRATADSKLMELSDRKDRTGSGKLKFASFSLKNKEGEQLAVAHCGSFLNLQLEVDTQGQSLNNVHISVGIDNDFGQRITQFNNDVTNEVFDIPAGKKYVNIRIPKLPLRSGQYSFTLYSTVNGELADWLQEAGTFFVEAGDFFNSGKLPIEGQGSFFIDHSFILD